MELSPTEPDECNERRGTFNPLHLARQYHKMLLDGEAANPTRLARIVRRTPARISQILALLRLAEPIQRYLDGSFASKDPYPLTERELRSIAGLRSEARQVAAFEHLLRKKGRAPMSRRG